MKIIKGFFNWIWEAVKESIAQLWTLLGFFIAWLTLTGTAQDVIDNNLLWSILVFVVKPLGKLLDFTPQMKLSTRLERLFSLDFVPLASWQF